MRERHISRQLAAGRSLKNAFCRGDCGQGRNKRGEREGAIPRAPNYYGGAEKPQQCHMYFLQYSTFASETPQIRTQGHQTCFLPRAPSSLVTPLVEVNALARSATAIQPVAVNRTLKRPFQRRTLCRTTKLIAEQLLIAKTTWSGVAKAHTLVGIQHPRWTVLITPPTRAMLFRKTGAPKLGTCTARSTFTYLKG